MYESGFDSSMYTDQDMMEDMYGCGSMYGNSSMLYEEDYMKSCVDCMKMQEKWFREEFSDQFCPPHWDW